MNTNQTEDGRNAGGGPGEDSGVDPQGDGVRRLVHVLMIVYLLPVFLLVFAVGAVLAAGVAVATTTGRVVQGLSNGWEKWGARVAPTPLVAYQGHRVGRVSRGARVLPKAGKSSASVYPRED